MADYVDDRTTSLLKINLDTRFEGDSQRRRQAPFNGATSGCDHKVFSFPSTSSRASKE